MGMGVRLPARALRALAVVALLGAACENLEPPPSKPGPPGGKASDLRTLSPRVAAGSTMVNTSTITPARTMDQRGAVYRSTSTVRALRPAQP
jgi:hypothetical protein